MKRWFLSILLTLACTWTWAQNTNEPFKGHLYNKEYKVYLHINFYQNNILIPGQELFGQVAGYFGADLDSRKWIFTTLGDQRLWQRRSRSHTHGPARRYIRLRTRQRQHHQICHPAQMAKDAAPTRLRQTITPRSNIIQQKNTNKPYGTNNISPQPPHPAQIYRCRPIRTHQQHSLFSILRHRKNRLRAQGVQHPQRALCHLRRTRRSRLPRTSL